MKNPNPRKPGRPPKNPPAQVSQNPANELDYLSSPNEADPSIVETVIEEHKEAGGLDLLTQASQVLEGARPSKNQRYKANVKMRKTAQQDDIQTIIATLLTLIVSAWGVPEDVKPNPDEVNAFSVPSTRLLLRHVPLASKLSQDALDIIGMIGALSAYYIRTGDAWRAYRSARAAQVQETAQVYTTPSGDPLDSLLHRQPISEEAMPL